MIECKHCSGNWKELNVYYESKENRAMILYDWILRNIEEKQWEKANLSVMFHKWRIEWLSIEKI